MFRWSTWVDLILLIIAEVLILSPIIPYWLCREKATGMIVSRRVRESKFGGGLREYYIPTVRFSTSQGEEITTECRSETQNAFLYRASQEVAVRYCSVYPRLCVTEGDPSPLPYGIASLVFILWVLAHLGRLLSFFGF